ncbi:MAG: hypothetical protein COA67_11020 [Lutibacter sp.]|nr:MAG: hypothetical protein COA67_11020 [Lutibacter sp.]
MRKITTNLFLLFVIVQVRSQENNIFTKTVQIEEFIPFVVNNFPKEIDVEKYRNITFLIPITNLGATDETSVILNQAFRLLSRRLNEEDMITLVVYSAINGEVLKSTSVKELKKILYALDNVNTSISELFEDGVQLGYDIADTNFDEDAVNTVVMIRSSAKVNGNSFTHQNVKPKKKKNNIVLLTLLGLAPEIISILKD